MKITALATLEAYSYHLLPILEAAAERGHDVRLVTGQKKADWGVPVDKSKLHEVDTDVWLAAGFVDYKELAKDRRPIVYVEHGAGQTYQGDTHSVDHASYSHGTLPRVAVFLCPNVFVLKRRQLAHSGRAVLVGSPRMDYFHRYAMHNETVQRGVVAFAWHWACHLNPETLTAWEHYRPHLVHVALKLRRAGLLPVMTSHPRIRQRVRYHAERAGFEWWDTDDVLMRAELLIADNTSVMYEFASLDRPVVALNAPWYRKTVSHGLRFWEAIPGPQVEDADELPEVILRELRHDTHAEQRRTVNAYVLPICDGLASERSVLAIEGLLPS